MLVMGKSVYTPEQKDFIRKYYPEHGYDWVAEKLNLKRSQIKNFASVNKIHRTNFHHNWTEQEIGKLKQEYSHRRTDLIATEMALTYRQICCMAYTLKLKKTDAFLHSPECNRLNGISGYKYRFKKGQIPPNKGLPMSDALREKVKHTWFPKGYEPPNTKYDGYERISKDGYREVRVSKGKFVALHRKNWEAQNGPIPEGMIMKSIDGDPTNCDPANWYLINRANQLGENSGRNELTDKFIVDSMTHRAPELKAAFAGMPEIIELKRNQLKLRRTINELTEVTTND